MNKNKSKDKPQEIFEGRFRVGKNGAGYMRINNQDETIAIGKHNRGSALNGDIVTVVILNKKRGYPEGKVTKVKHRDKVGFSGILEPRQDNFIISPKNEKEELTIKVPKKFSSNAHKGDYVFVTIIKWEEPLTGQVDRVFKKQHSMDTLMEVTSLEKGFHPEFPPDVSTEAEAIAIRGITKDDYKNRRDFRKVPTMTIDPDTAKDYDDALSFQKINDNEYEIGIHIADVSNYVTEGTAIDVEAASRATSVYLVDRTIPMLPHVLSNDLCSLVQEQDRLAFSAVFTINKNGDVLNQWIGKTVINSNKRFTYKEASEIIENNNQNSLFKFELDTMYEISRNLNSARFKNGALMIGTGEVEFILDENGKPLDIHPKESLITHNMIEEFMLLANRQVAHFMSEHSKVPFFVYRIHDIPDINKMKYLKEYLIASGYNPPMKDGIIPTTYLNKIIENAPEQSKQPLSLMIARSMQKAIYSTDNIGHYGLGFEFYTHFTSPIRRYPDLIVHRLVAKALNKIPIKPNHLEEYKEISLHSSTREKDAQDAEYSSIRYKQAEYMQSHLGEEYKCIITGYNKFGMFISELQTRAEGFARFNTQSIDKLEFDQKSRLIRGKKHKVIRIGDYIKAIVVKADNETGLIDYKISDILSN